MGLRPELSELTRRWRWVSKLVVSRLPPSCWNDSLSRDRVGSKASGPRWILRASAGPQDSAAELFLRSGSASWAWTRTIRDGSCVHYAGVRKLQK